MSSYSTEFTYLGEEGAQQTPMQIATISSGPSRLIELVTGILFPIWVESIMDQKYGDWKKRGMLGSVAIVITIILQLVIFAWVAVQEDSESIEPEMDARAQDEAETKRRVSALFEIFINRTKNFNITLTHKKVEEVAGSDDTPQCSICFEEVEPGTVVTSLEPFCSHWFHTNCLKAWLLKIKFIPQGCPVCRSEVNLDNMSLDQMKERYNAQYFDLNDESTSFEFEWDDSEGQGMNSFDFDFDMLADEDVHVHIDIH